VTAVHFAPVCRSRTDSHVPCAASVQAQGLAQPQTQAQTESDTTESGRAQSGGAFCRGPQPCSAVADTAAERRRTGATAGCFRFAAPAAGDGFEPEAECGRPSNSTPASHGYPVAAAGGFQPAAIAGASWRPADPRYRMAVPDVVGIDTSMPWYYIHRNDYPKAQESVARLHQEFPDWKIPEDLQQALTQKQIDQARDRHNRSGRSRHRSASSRHVFLQDAL